MQEAFFSVPKEIVQQPPDGGPEAQKKKKKLVGIGKDRCSGSNANRVDLQVVLDFVQESAAHLGANQQLVPARRSAVRCGAEWMM